MSFMDVWFLMIGLMSCSCMLYCCERVANLEFISCNINKNNVYYIHVYITSDNFPFCRYKMLNYVVQILLCLKMEMTHHLQLLWPWPLLLQMGALSCQQGPGCTCIWY